MLQSKYGLHRLTHASESTHKKEGDLVTNKMHPKMPKQWYTDNSSTYNVSIPQIMMHITSNLIFNREMRSDFMHLGRELKFERWHG